MHKIKMGLFHRERGQAFLVVLVLLVVGGIIITPFLYLSSTTLKHVKVTETQLKGLYAADAGMEYAYWKFFKPPSTPYPPATPYHDNLPIVGNYTVNNMPVSITTDQFVSGDYRWVIYANVTNTAGESVVNKKAWIKNSGGNLILTYASPP